MIVAGVMSGTSADGIDVALVRIDEATRRGRSKRSQTNSPPELLGHAQVSYPADVRRVVLGSMNSPRASVADLARLNFLLGDLYAEAVLLAQKKLRLKADLIGCHGQTLYHQGSPAPYLGRELAVTWQAGEASRIAARLGVPVVSDFRPADMAAGGKGAPLVPYLDFLVYGDPNIGRIALNIGGIANLTALPARATLHQVLAFDTGPGNMVIDALTEQLFGEPCDRDGKIAASGRVLEPILGPFLKENFFRQKPPKSAGREEFGREFGREFLHACNALQGATNTIAGARAIEKRDIIATATALTARSVRDAIYKYVIPKADFSELIVSGGGTKNPTLMASIRHELDDCGLKVRLSEEFGIPSEAKEALAFAVLAFETWNRRPSNVPSATGARRAAVLGKISYP
ncbi:MAG: anhydro-N-acetylmuramic acid kinase [Acidobacteria bacterium]|nr:anhydro-N-acetylmuramic acid kinase [Acidobacteriota bacterium]